MSYNELEKRLNDIRREDILELLPAFIAGSTIAIRSPRSERLWVFERSTKLFCQLHCKFRILHALMRVRLALCLPAHKRSEYAWFVT